MLCPSARWLQRILDVCQAYAESHGIIFNCNKTVCMTFKAKSARSTATPVLKLGGQYVNSVDQYKYLGIVSDNELSDDKDIQSICCMQVNLSFFLSELFNMCIVHRYVPNSCLNTTILPICKDKNGNMSDTSNYRPVAVATVMSKLLEHFILSLSSISLFLGTTDNQFGFKAGHSTDQEVIRQNKW